MNKYERFIFNITYYPVMLGGLLCLLIGENSLAAALFAMLAANNTKKIIKDKWDQYGI